MSSVTSSAPLSLIWRGTWQASGVNSNGYQRYDCVSHTVTSPTTRTDLYFAVTEIASGGAEPNPTSGQTTWKVLLEGGTIAASDGSIVYHDAEGNNVLVQAAADRILEVVDGIPQFVQRDPAPVATFEAYKHPNISGEYPVIGTTNTFWIAGGRVYGLGMMQEGFVQDRNSEYRSTLRETLRPALFAPRDDDAQVPIGKIFHGHRCIFAIGEDDKSKVYGLGLNAGRFGDGTDDLTTFVYEAFQKIQFFEDNGINIEKVVTRYLGVGAQRVDESSTGSRTRDCIAYFIQEVVDVGGVDTGGNVYISASSSLSVPNVAGGITRDGTVRQLTGFDQPIIGGMKFNSSAIFWSKRKVYGLGLITTTAGGSNSNLSTVTEIGSFSSDIVSFYAASENVAAVTLADGTAYFYNFKTNGGRANPLFEQAPVISGKLYRKFITNSSFAAGLMDDGSIYWIGLHYTSSGTATGSATPAELELPFDLVAADIVDDRAAIFHIITTDGQHIIHRSNTRLSTITNTAYRMILTFNGNQFPLYVDPGWVGRAESIRYYDGGGGGNQISLQTEDGYIYNSNTIGSAVDQDDDTIDEIVANTGRNVGINFQHQIYYASSVSHTITAGSIGLNAIGGQAHAATGLFGAFNGSTTFSVTINGSMVQRPTLRSYQVT